MFTSNNKAISTFDIYVDSKSESVNANELMLKECFNKLSSYYYYLKFDEIVVHVSEILPEFWTKNPDLYFLMLKFHLFELVKSNRKDEAFSLYYASVLPKINLMDSVIKERKNMVYNYILNRVDLVRSNFYINKAEFYFQMFLEKFQLEARNFYVGMENFYFQIKLKEIETKIQSLEDIEDGLYLNAVDLLQNFHSHNYTQEDNEFFNVFDDQKEENIIAALPPNTKVTANQLLNQSYNVSYMPGRKNQFGLRNSNVSGNGDMDLDDLILDSANFMKSIETCDTGNFRDSNFSLGIVTEKLPEEDKEDDLKSVAATSITLNLKEKIRIPYLKKFNPKQIKREELDKKIIRKFKKYLKDSFKADELDLSIPEMSFWKDFGLKNLLPPMSIVQGEEKLEFKSFNSNYIVWLFSQKNAKNLYKKFAEEKKDELFESIKTMIKTSFTDDIIIELTSVYEYIVKFCDIYNFSISDNASVVVTSTKSKNNHLEPPRMSTFVEIPEEEKRDAVDVGVANSIGFSKNKSFYESEEKVSDGVDFFQNIDFFKNIGEKMTDVNDFYLHNYNANEEKDYSPFDNYDYISDDDFGKAIQEGKYSRKGSYI